MTTARHLLLGAMLLASGAASCVLLVSPESRGAHCGFRGAETACGACLKERCQSAIDAICLDDPAGVLPVLEQCAAAGDDACSRLPSSAVATCTTGSCAGYCTARSGTSTTRCEESFLAPGLACGCQTQGVATDLDCSQRTFPRTHCCALQDRCECRPRACTGGEREVAVCNADALLCPPNTTEVESCSIRR